MSSTNVEDFFPSTDPSAKTTDEPALVTGKKSKKRKSDNKAELDSLKKKARLYSKPEQWRSVSKYNEKRLSEFCEEHEWREQQHLYDTIFKFAHSMLGTFLDKMSGGNGFVREEIENDISLLHAIESEGATFVALLNNKVKLLALAAVDTVNGKRNQIAAEPVESVIEEENGTEEAEADCEEHQDMVGIHLADDTTTEKEADTMCEPENEQA